MEGLKMSPEKGPSWLQLQWEGCLYSISAKSPIQNNRIIFWVVNKVVVKMMT